MTYHDEVLQALSVIQDPDLHNDIVSLGFIKELQISDAKDVSFTIELTTPACPVKEDFRKKAQDVVKALGWVNTVSVQLSSMKKNTPIK